MVEHGESPEATAGSFYDEAGVHGRYTDHRDGERHLNPNHVMEEPAFLAEVGDPSGLRVLDLGCGDGAFALRLFAAGAAGYTGIDSSRRMIEAARRNLAGTAAMVELADIDGFVPQPGSFDLITARLSLHYLADLDRVMAASARGLVAGGRLIFSVVHPVITSFDNKPSGPRTSWLVDDYFDTGPRLRDWLGSTVTWQHRTIADYVAAMVRAGLTVTALRECEPVAARFDGHLDEFARRRRVPLFLLLAARAGSAA